MHAALVLVDLQRDFLERPGLVPAAGAIIARAAVLLGACRARGLPVVHVQTVIRPDGSDRMPHWIDSDHWECVEGTAGALAPAPLAPHPGETVIRKPCFSGFGNPALEPGLRAAAVDTLLVAGIYLHGCVRSTVLDAYERGFRVWVADDATGSTEPAHASHTRQWLASRAARFMTVDAMLAGLDAEPARREA